MILRGGDAIHTALAGPSRVRASGEQIGGKYGD
jgi:hypothetical protein